MTISVFLFRRETSREVEMRFSDRYCMQREGLPLYAHACSFDDTPFDFTLGVAVF